MTANLIGTFCRKLSTSPPSGAAACSLAALHPFLSPRRSLVRGAIRGPCRSRRRPRHGSRLTAFADAKPASGMTVWKKPPAVLHPFGAAARPSGGAAPLSSPRRRLARGAIRDPCRSLARAATWFPARGLRLREARVRDDSLEEKPPAPPHAPRRRRTPPGGAASLLSSPRRRLARGDIRGPCRRRRGPRNAFGNSLREPGHTVFARTKPLAWLRRSEACCLVLMRAMSACGATVTAGGASPWK